MLILSYIFLLSTAIFIAFRSLICYAFAKFKNKENPNPEAISWIICAKDEAALLAQNLDFWLEQEFSNWELIIVLDRCKDNSLDIVLPRLKTHPNLKLVQNTSSKFPGKRNALIAGAEYAAHDNILLSDADCRPASKVWLKKMAAQFDADTDFVIGFSPYEKKKGLLNLIVRYETFLSAMLYGAAAILGQPYMAVGRNLGLKKKYLHAKYFQGQESISGDDDLLINKWATKKNTKLCLEEKALVYSEPKLKWKDFLQQKQRHTGAGNFYSLKSKFFLGLFYSSLILFNSSGIFIVLFYAANPILFYIFIAAILLNTLLLLYIGNKTNFKFNLFKLVIGDFCLSFFLISLGILSRRGVEKW